MVPAVHRTTTLLCVQRRRDSLYALLRDSDFETMYWSRSTRKQSFESIQSQYCNYLKDTPTTTKMSTKNTVLYVGGVDNAVTEEIIHAAFIPFGEIKSVQLPKNYKENKNRGFAFVEFVLPEDATDALENMEGSELYGKVLHVSIAKALPKAEKGQAVWASEEWINSEIKAAEDDDEYQEPLGGM